MNNWITMRGPSSPLSVLIEDYRIAREAKLSPHTVKGYVKALSELDALMGHPTLAGFTSANVSPVITRKRKTSPSNARLIAAVAKAFGSWLEQTGLTENPVKDLGVPKFNGRRRAFSDEDFRRILQVLTTLPGHTRRRDRALVLLGLGSGLRSNEMRLLEKRDVHLEKPLTDSWAYIRWDTSKSGYERRVRLDADAAAAIHDYINNERPEVDGPLFLRNSGGQFTYDGWSQMFYAIRDHMAGLGIKGFGAHKLRHQWATLGARTGMTYAEMCQEGGWRRGSKVPSAYIDEIPFEELQKRPSPMTAFLRRAS